jgi:chorismate synthase
MVMRVALGSLTRKFPHDLDVEVGSQVTTIHAAGDELGPLADLSSEGLNARIDAFPARCLDPEAEVHLQVRAQY